MKTYTCIELRMELPTLLAGEVEPNKKKTILKNKFRLTNKSKCIHLFINCVMVLLLRWRCNVSQIMFGDPAKSLLLTWQLLHPILPGMIVLRVSCEMLHVSPISC